MYKIILTIVLANIFGCAVYGQKDSISKADRAALDSMMKNDEFLKLMADSKKNSLEVSVGIGNGSFSSHNRAVNATGQTNQVIFTPAVFYRTKGGFSVGVTAYLSNDSVNSKLYQTGLSAAYDYTGKQVSAGISYTRYISDQSIYNSKSIYQNDLYAYVKKASGIIQPVFAFGYSGGKFKEIDKIKFPPGSGITRKDSTDNTTSYFYTSVGVEHDFNFYNIFSKDDELDFVPAFAINAGSDKTNTTHTDKAFANLKVLARRQRVAASNKYELQSVAASFDFTYSVGKFFLQPNLYLDYYLPSTTAKRLTAVYSLTAGFSF